MTSWLFHLHSRDYTKIVAWRCKMSKIFIAISLAALAWALPAQSGATVQSNEGAVIRTTPAETGLAEAITPVSARFSIQVGPYGTFASGRFGGHGFNHFKNRGFYPYKGFYPNRFGRYRGYGYGPKPFLGQYGAYNRDPFFCDNRLSQR